MLYIIGLGLSDERDITVRGLEAVKKCKHVYLEHYTAILMVDVPKLEEFYGKKVELADRDFVEQGCDEMLEQSKEEDVAFLVVGDPFAATTHTDLILRAKGLGIKVQNIHNASIMNACAACGLQLYRFGECVSIPWWDWGGINWKPDSFYGRIKHNRSAGLHTLCLLDIKVKEPNIEQLARGRTVYEGPRYMSVAESIDQLLQCEEMRGEGVYDENTMAIGLARIGSEDQVMAAGPMKLLREYEMGPPLHAMIICGELHDLELEFMRTFEVEEGCVCAQPMPAFAIAEGNSAAQPAATVPEASAPGIAPKREEVPFVRATPKVREESSDDELDMGGDGLADFEDALVDSD